MPWKETCAMDQRVQFIGDWLSGKHTKCALCEAYQISRPTADKWIVRYEAEGLDGLKERSRAPHSHPNAVDEAVRGRIIEAKLSHQHWGPKKVMDWLRRTHPAVAWPADSTAGVVLKRAGLVQSRRRRRRVAPHGEPFAACEQPNDVWSADFKGDFVLGNGRRCYPLTITDNTSRYLLQCRALSRPSFAATRGWFEWVLREYGLPSAIRTDNGAPFASLAVGGLSRLSAWWIRLGIRPERIKPGRPDQNGRHERMHRTLKEAVVVPPEMSLEAQQRRFDAFVTEYNGERSHEALGRRTPAELYEPCTRAYPVKLAAIEYDTAYTVRQVRHNGEVKWKGERIYVSEVLAREPVGLHQLDEFRWELRYSFHPLGVLDERTKTISPPERWHPERENV